MKKLSLLSLAIFALCMYTHADVTFKAQVPAGTKYCYITGGLTQLASWSAGDAIPLTKVTDNLFQVTVSGITVADVEASEGYKYLCHTDWAYEENRTAGSGGNRKTVGNPDIVTGWKKTYTSDVLFVKIPTTLGEKEVKVLLPADYQAATTKNYDLLIAPSIKQRYRLSGADDQYGDDLFASASWNVESTAAALQASGRTVPIIVSINGFLENMTPFANDDFAGSGKAARFAKCIKDEIVPALKAKYRINENLHLAAFDISGLFALYTALEYQNEIASCVLFSPAIWINRDDILSHIASWKKSSNVRVMIAVGDKDIDMQKQDMADLIAQLSAKGFTDETLFSYLYTNTVHDDISWGKQYADALAFVNGETLPANANRSDFSVTQNTIQKAASNTNYTFVANGTCDTQTKTVVSDFYKNGTEKVSARILVKEIPTNGKTETYYWNLNDGANCDGSNYFATNKDIGFKSSRTTTALQRVALFDDGTESLCTASQKHFRLVVGANSYILNHNRNHNYSYTANFTAIKDFTIHYGSVNSGSDQGAIASAAVSSTCLKAKISFSFFTNKITIEELEHGDSDIYPNVAYFKSEKALVSPGETIKISAQFSDKKSYKTSYRTSLNYAAATTATPTISGSDEIITISNAQSGIYYIYMDLEKNGTKTENHLAIAVKVVDNAIVNPYLVVNAYEDIDWESIGKYKANFHTHTTQSNDANFSTAETVDKYHQKGYKILALTDHDYNPYPWELFGQFKYGVEARSPEDLGMLAVPGNELSKDKNNTWNQSNGDGEFNHHNDFFTGRQGQEFGTLQESYAYTYALGGLQIINHPGQYWKIENTYTEGQKNSPSWHADNFRKYPSLIGLEVYNQGNRRPNDRILWDQILTITMPERPVWGYSCDDTHNDAQFFGNYQYMLMDEFDIESLKETMKKGSLYFSYEPLHTGDAKAPKINSIVVDETNKTITIDTPDKNVYWISGTDKNGANSTRKSTVIAYGKTFSYANFCGTYVRAFITNDFGETCTQPFGFHNNPEVSVNEIQEDFLQIFPNPTTNDINIVTTENVIGENYTIYDITGKIVKSEMINSRLTSINVQSFSEGLYLVKVGDFVSKFIKK